MTCNSCNKHDFGPCDCGYCKPAKYGCDFNIMANPFDESIWNVTINGATTRVKIPKINETDTKLSTNYTAASLIYNAERHVDTITGPQLGALINVEDLRDTETSNADSCDLFVFNPFCSDCGDGCAPKNARWTNYHIPDAGETPISPDSDGYYRVLTKNDCGCIEEGKLPVSPSGATSIDYMRDSVPDDPDFPWYYGCYNDTINLHLAQNAPRFFGLYPLKVTVNYGVQAIISEFCPNYNFRSILAPVIAGQSVNIEMEASTVQGFAAWTSAGNRSFPWGTASLRSSFTFIVPKGKEASLYHEYRIRTGSSVPDYWYTPKDGQKVPPEEIGIDQILYPASRLHALQIIVEPTLGDANFNPVTDTVRDQLDDPVDIYPNPVG